MDNKHYQHSRNQSDAEIWSRLVDQDMDALSYLFKKYYSLLFNYGLKMVRDDQLIEDTIQDVFYKFWKKSQSLDKVENPKSYILRSFRNTLIDRITKLKNQEKATFTFIHETESVQDKIIEEESHLEMRKRIDQGLDNLPERQREIIYLRFYQDMDYQQISEALGINYQSVRNSVHASVKKLRQTLISAALLVINTFI